MGLIDEIQNGAIQIRDETKEGGNTAERVGGVLLKIGQVLEETGVTGTVKDFKTALDDSAGDLYNNK